MLSKEKSEYKCRVFERDGVMMIANGYDVVVLASSKNITTLKYAIPFYYSKLNAEQVFVISALKNKNEIEKISGTTFINENMIYPGLNIQAVSSTIESIVRGVERVQGGTFSSL